MGSAPGLPATPQVVVTRTPLRVSFAGGGTDLAAFYERDYGAVFSMTITSYIYVTVKRHSPLFNEPIRLNYSQSEEVNEIDEIQNDIARECLRLLGIEPPIYISTVGDHPASSGLGGSSSFAVGLLHALHTFKGERVSAAQLAEEASHIEIDVLGWPIGKQDQYAAAFGGLNLFVFQPGGGVTLQPEQMSSEATRAFFDSLIMFWTGHQRDSKVVLAEQKGRLLEVEDSLLRMREHAHALHRLFQRNGKPIDAAVFGRTLDESWRLKRDLASTITTSQIDAWYEAAVTAGAYGGKLCGAGGGGCLLFVVDPARRDDVRQALSELMEVPLGYEARGSRVLLPLAY
jgi:D-glycero-alpha-D-manno-heptose-7-phosphate kinase